MDSQEELAFLRSVAASQLQTIKALTLGCEKYGLTETTPIVRHLAAQDDEIERLRAELAEAKEALRLCVDVIQHISYAWQGQGTHPQTAINAALRLYEINTTMTERT